MLFCCRSVCTLYVGLCFVYQMGDSLLKGMKELNESMQRSIEKMKKRKQDAQGTTSPASPAPDKDRGEGMI